MAGGEVEVGALPRDEDDSRSEAEDGGRGGRGEIAREVCSGWGSRDCEKSCERPGRDLILD